MGIKKKFSASISKICRKILYPYSELVKKLYLVHQDCIIIF